MIGKTLVTTLTMALLGGSAMSQAALPTITVGYELGGTKFESTIIGNRPGGKPLPGLLMVPNWMGPSATSLEKARRIAADGYVVMMVDMYGVGTRPANAQEAAAAASSVRADRALMRARAQKALDVFREQGAAAGLDPEKVAAIGFCFGGGTVLELGRSGADLAAIVSFHGDLASPTLAADAGKTTAKVLVCHGADDPHVPQQDVQTWIEAMRATDVDWQLVQYSGTVHSFTDPTAASDGSRYHERSAQRAFASMHALLRSLWAE